MANKMVLVNPRKFARSITILAVTATAAIAFISGQAADASGSSGTPTIISVHSGETLWQIAERVSPNTDPRDFIADVVAANRLVSPDVVPGQQLVIPNR